MIQYKIVETSTVTDEELERIVMETLTGMKRAGADMILTYHAVYAAELLAK